MSVFVVETNEDGSIQRMLKNGVELDAALRLEQHYSMSRSFFDGAYRNYVDLCGAGECAEKRRFGLQCFLMTMSGLEAFVNTYFRARVLYEPTHPAVARIQQSHGSVTKKISDLMVITDHPEVQDIDRIIEEIFEIYRFRSEIVHPKWQPAGLVIPGEVALSISGLAQNDQLVLEDNEYCEAALNWCLLLIARLGQAIPVSDIQAHLFHWTGQSGIEVAAIEDALNLETQA